MSSLRARRIARNPFAFPGGNPGFNPAHPLAAGISAGYGFSGVASAGGFISLLTGARGTVVGAPTASIQAGIGPAIDYPATSACHTFGGQSLVSPTQATFVAIVQYDSVPTSTSAVFNTSGTNTGIGLAASSTGKVMILALGGTNATTTGLTVAANVPYFIAAINQPTGGSAYFVFLNLRTGVLLTETTARAVPGTTSDGTYSVGNTPSSNRPALAKIQAVMFSPLAVSPQALSQWAYDPFSFWYPN